MHIFQIKAGTILKLVPPLENRWLQLYEKFHKHNYKFWFFIAWQRSVGKCIIFFNCARFSKGSHLPRYDKQQLEVFRLCTDGLAKKCWRSFTKFAKNPDFCQRGKYWPESEDLDLVKKTQFMPQQVCTFSGFTRVHSVSNSNAVKRKWLCCTHKEAISRFYSIDCNICQTTTKSAPRVLRKYCGNSLPHMRELFIKVR